MLDFELKSYVLFVGDVELLKELRKRNFEGYLLGISIEHLKSQFKPTQWTTVQQKSKYIYFYL